MKTIRRSKQVECRREFAYEEDDFGIIHYWCLVCRFMHFEKRPRDEAFKEVLELTRKIPDTFEQNYVTALILGLSGRNLTDAQKQLLKETMRMTDVVRELVHEIEQEALEKGRKEGQQEGAEKKAREVALNLLAEGVTVDVIAKATGLSREQIEELQKQLH
jgi:predicted transposase YdaD